MGWVPNILDHGTPLFVLWTESCEQNRIYRPGEEKKQKQKSLPKAALSTRPSPYSHSREPRTDTFLDTQESYLRATPLRHSSCVWCARIDLWAIPIALHGRGFCGRRRQPLRGDTNGPTDVRQWSAQERAEPTLRSTKTKHQSDATTASSTLPGVTSHQPWLKEKARNARRPWCRMMHGSNQHFSTDKSGCGEEQSHMWLPEPVRTDQQSTHRRREEKVLTTTRVWCTWRNEATLPERDRMDRGMTGSRNDTCVCLPRTEFERIGNGGVVRKWTRDRWTPWTPTKDFDVVQSQSRICFWVGCGLIEMKGMWGRETGEWMTPWSRLFWSSKDIFCVIISLECSPWHHHHREERNTANSTGIRRETDRYHRIHAVGQAMGEGYESWKARVKLRIGRW